MPPAMSNKRSHSDSLGSQPLQKTKLDVQKFLAELSKDLQDRRIRNVLVESAIQCATISGGIDKMAEAIKAAKFAFAPLVFSEHVEDARQCLNDIDLEPRGKLRGSHLEEVVGQEISDSIVRTVQEKFLAKVHRDMCYETKYNALSALVDLGWLIVNTDTDETLSEPCQSGPVPKTLIEGMLTISKRMMATEVQRVVLETDAETQQFIAKRRMEMEDPPAQVEERGRYVSPLARRYSGLNCIWNESSDSGFSTDADAEVRTLDAEKSLIVRVLRLRWESTKNRHYSKNWKKLDEVVAFFMDGLKNAVVD